MKKITGPNGEVMTYFREGGVSTDHYKDEHGKLWTHNITAKTWTKQRERKMPKTRQKRTTTPLRPWD